MRKSLLSAVAVTALMAFSSSAWAEVVIAVAGPITGPNAAFGAQLQKGAEQAAADINAAGGMNGEQIRIVIGDDVSDPKQGISVANKFVGDGVKFVVGHFNSGVSIPASEVYAENGILQITPASTNPQFTERDAVYYHLADALVKLNRQAEAVPLFEKIEKEFEQSEYIVKAKERLAEIKSAASTPPAPPKS